MPSPANRIWTLMARKLNQEISAAELQELEQLLPQYPDEHYAVEIITEQWQQSPKKDIAPLQPGFEKLWEAIQTQELQKSTSESLPEVPQLFAEQKPRIKKWIWQLVSAAIIIGVGLFAVNIFTQNSTSTIATITPNEITTKYGSKTKILLPDSTQVWLNSGSKLTYDNNYGKVLREIKLIGEAYFDVVKNSGKPFIIHTDKMDIKVLGTAFNVKCYPDEKSVETSLIHGSIEVTLKNRQSEKIMLKPNEKLILTDEADASIGTNKKASNKNRNSAPVQPLVSITPITYDDRDNEVIETAWVNNRLVFNKETFEELALKMERWYGVSITFKNERLRQNRITGTFENETIQQALQALQYTTAFKYTINKNEIVLFK